MGTAKQKIIAIVLTFFCGVYPAATFASPENDRIYSLETLGWLKAVDNVDGIFSGYVDEVYSKYFENQSRFQVKTLSKVDEVLSKSKIPYATLIKDTEIIRKIALKLRVESILRTRVYKEGDSYRFNLEWVFAPRGDILAEHEFRFVDPKKEKGFQEEDLPNAIHAGLNELIAKLPFLGQITGIDGETVTVNIGRNLNVKASQRLTVYSLQAVKRHPLTKSIEEWRWQPVGKILVEQVEDSMLFGRVLTLEPNARMMRYQKVREIVDPPAEEVKAKDVDEEGNPVFSGTTYDRLGYVAANLGLGIYSRESGINNDVNARGGSGWQSNFEIEGQGWINSRFVAELSLMGGLINYSPTNLVSGADIGTSYSGTVTQFRMAAGYSLLEVKTIFDPAVIFKIGYRDISYALASTASDLTGSSSTDGLFLGLGAQMPVRNGYGLVMGIDLNLLKGHTQKSPDMGANTSNSDIMFLIGGTYHYDQRILFRGLFRFNANSADFANGGSVNQQLISFCPSVAYTF